MTYTLRLPPASATLPAPPDFVYPRRRQAVEQVRRDPHQAPNGKYYMYFGDKDIYCALDDLIHWTPGPSTSLSCPPTPRTSSDELLKPGPPPLITDNGYILLIHNAAAKDPDGKLIYRAGQALIDPAKPTEELAR